MLSNYLIVWKAIFMTPIPYAIAITILITYLKERRIK